MLLALVRHESAGGPRSRKPFFDEIQKRVKIGIGIFADAWEPQYVCG